MAGQEPKSKPGGWRGKRPSAAASAGGSAAQEAGWARRPDRSAQAATRWHRSLIGVWLLVALTLIGGFLSYLMYRPIRTPLLLAAATRYAPPWPPNAWAREDLESLTALDRQEVATCLSIPWESTAEGLRRLRDQLDVVRPGGPGKDVVIVYLSMHGAVDAQGQPCLVPPGAALDGRGWLPVRELLQTLFVDARPGGLPGRVRKLLVLDAGRMHSNWDAGILYNAFAERLAEVVNDLKVPNLAVLNSTRPGQVARTSRELGGSVFGHFFLQGLQGAADVEQGDRNGRVSLQELQRFLAAHVRQWTMENRADPQTPMLIPADAEMTLVHAGSALRAAATNPSPALDPRWAEISRLWLRHQELAGLRPYRLRPLAWETFQHQLLRLEQLTLAGAAYEDEFRQTQAELSALADQLAAQAAPRRLPAFSLPLAAQFGWWTKEEAARLERESPWNESESSSAPALPAAVGGQPEAKPGAKSTETGAAPPQDAAGPLPPPPASAEQPAAKPPAVATSGTALAGQPANTAPKGEPRAPLPAAADQPDYDPAAAAAWNWCLDNATRDQVDRVLAFLAGTKGQRSAEAAEIHFLRILAEQLDWQSAAGRVPDALLVRRWASTAGAPAEPQIQYLIRPLVDRADAVRRLGDDQLLVGTPAALDQADARWSEAVGSEDAGTGYRWSVTVAERAAAATALRDRAWAELPALAQWALGGSPPTRDANSPDLRSLILGVHALSSEIERAILQGAATRELAAATTALQTKLAAWDKIVADENYRLRAMAGDDQNTLREIENLLSVPLVSGVDRNQLREKYLRIARSLVTATGAGSASAADVPAAAPPDTAAPSLAPLLPAREHPALTILDRTFLQPSEGRGGAATAPREPATAAETNGDSLTRDQQVQLLTEQGGTIRGLLESLRATAAAQLAQTREAVESAESAPQPAAVLRAGASRADRLVRAAAGLCGRPLWAAAREAPSLQLAELDLRFLFDWQAQRALDDFWGSGEDSARPYFQIVASEYLAAARELAQPLGVPSAEEQRLAERAERLAQAAALGIQTTTPDLLVDEAETFLIHATSASLAPSLPAGVSTLAIRFADGRPVPLARPDQLETPLNRLTLPVTEPPSASSLSYAIRNQPDLTQQRSLSATVYYRGHAWHSEVFVQPAHGLEIVSEPPRYPVPTVTVFGQARQQASVVFILDCSGSMNRRLGGIETHGRMIDLARDTLESILARLTGPDAPFRVGVSAYGHRCGWNPAPGRHTELVIPDPARPGQFLPAPPEFALHPNSDVESILPLGAFSERIRRDLESRLDGLAAMGQTPLYLAIIQAIAAVRTEPAENRLHVVAITDGFNEQTSGGPPTARKFRKDVEDALTALGDRQVQLDIVGFDLVAKTPTEQSALQDAIAIAARTGGAFHSAADPSSLLKALEKSLGLVQYTVQPMASPTAAPGPPIADPTELGRATTVEQPAEAERDYRVALVDPERPAAADIVLEGGEGIQLYLAVDPQSRQRRLVHQRYNRDLRAAAEAVVDPLDAGRRFFLGAHLPERLGQSVRFPVSIQNADAEQFSPRPVEAWVEIRPRLPDGALGPAYIFYDVPLEPARPVPVLSCLAPAWPPPAASAVIRLWFKRSKTEPDLAVPLARFAEQTVGIDAAPEVRFALEVPPRAKPEDPHQVILTERHPPGSGLDAVKVEAWPPPERTIHRYSFETATIRHTFIYRSLTAGPMGEARILLTSRQRLAEKAVTPAEPLEVTLPRAAVPLGR